MGVAYYNEHDPAAAEWLVELIRAGLIAPGVVDDRDIQSIRENDLAAYTQVHLFAGIGGWSYALRLAGWPDDRPVWTGSCPCQPFSTAGKGQGVADSRHLWPEMFRLAREHRPATIFGEQVASPAGRSWFDAVSADLESVDYAVGAADLCAAGVGAPHIRQRLYWVAHTDDARPQGRGCSELPKRAGECASGAGGASGGLAAGPRAGRSDFRPGPTYGYWGGADWLGCTDGVWRPVGPGTFPLAHGIPDRVGLLRGYGNAIVPQLAANFIKAYCEIERLDMEASDATPTH